MKIRRPIQYSGFTLFELLVVLSILSVVSTIGLTGFVRMTTHWNDLQHTMRLNKGATSAFSALANDFENILSSRVAGVGMRGQPADTEDNVRYWRLSFEDDRISMPAVEYNPVTDAYERVSVYYAIDRTGSVPQLVRSAAPLGQTIQSGRRAVVADDITGMRVQYFDGRVWRSQWDGIDMPQAVRVSVSMMKHERPDRHTARVATFRIHVK